MFDELLRQAKLDIACLPLGSVQLAGGLVAVCPGVPPTLMEWLLMEMGQRVDMREVSPVAEAAMCMLAFSRYSDSGFCDAQMQRQHALIMATEKEHALRAALEFLQKLLRRIEETLKHDVRQTERHP